MIFLSLWGCSEQSLNEIDNSKYVDGALIEVDPEIIDFGLVFGPQEASFTVRSVGVQPLEVSDLQFVGPDALNFTLLNEDDVSYTLDPEEERTIELIFTPIEAGAVQAQAIVSSNDYYATNTAVTLLGEGPESDLKITPNPYDFGDVLIGCGQLGELTIENTGNEPITVSDISHSEGAFSIFSAATLPLELQPGATSMVELAYDPLTEEDSSGTLTVVADDTLGTHTALQMGTGVLAGEVEQIWDNAIDPPSDIMFAVDHSCSMSDDASAVASNFSSFIGQLSNYSNDWQIMVGFGEQGCNLGGILTPNTPDYVTTFQNSVQCDWSVPECNPFNFSSSDPYEEALLTTASLSIDNTDPGECNAGFMRADALLHIVLVSDEPDQSNQDWQTLADQIIDKKGSAGMVRISAIAGDYPSGCESGSNSADAGTGYWEATNYTNGVFLSICSAWADPANIELLAEASVLLDTYPLNTEPVEGTIHVYVNGAEPSSDIWYYDESLNSVVFSQSIPGEGSQVRIEYVPAVPCD